LNRYRGVRQPTKKSAETRWVECVCVCVCVCVVCCVCVCVCVCVLCVCVVCCVCVCVCVCVREREREKQLIVKDLGILAKCSSSTRQSNHKYRKSVTIFVAVNSLYTLR